MFVSMCLSPSLSVCMFINDFQDEACRPSPHVLHGKHRSAYYVRVLHCARSAHHTHERSNSVFSMLTLFSVSIALKHILKTDLTLISYSSTLSGSVSCSLGLSSSRPKVSSTSFVTSARFACSSLKHSLREFYASHASSKVHAFSCVSHHLQQVKREEENSDVKPETSTLYPAHNTDRKPQARSREHTSCKCTCLSHEPLPLKRRQGDVTIEISGEGDEDEVSDNIVSIGGFELSGLFSKLPTTPESALDPVKSSASLC